ncbi:CU044_5270 family protein [Streptomyces sp. NBC_01410]|uniref:CU044_5270 family protein n=1 Tax=Streptomyces sp. NBC_01410 TaxID=2903856 RepID=UPI00324FE7DD
MTELPERDLPPGRHRVLKEHLMSEIRTPDRTPHRAKDRTQDNGVRVQGKPMREGWRRPGVLAPLAAVAVAASVIAGLVFTGHDAGGVRPAPSEAAALLEDVALAAEHGTVPGDIRDDQFVYIESKVGYVGYQAGRKPKLEPIHKREVWRSVDGSRAGFLREANHVGQRPLNPDTPGVESNTNYRHLQTLPTDPDAMLTWLHKVDRGEGGKSKDQNAFVLVGDLVAESLMPPKVSAALYRAAAKIPGVQIVEDSVDAAGRHGVAVAREDSGIREELIFDKKTKKYLGERSVAVRDIEGGLKKGELEGSSAILQRAVVDRVRQTP